MDNSPHSQFDFWLGQWNVTWGEDGRGANTIHRILNDKVIEEQFDGRPGLDFQGMSISAYDERAGRWKQTWVDSEGNYLDFVGDFADGKMILTRDSLSSDGQPLKQRMVWYAIRPDALDWNWERSTDGGQTWEVLWHIHYTRRG